MYNPPAITKLIDNFHSSSSFSFMAELYQTEKDPELPLREIPGSYGLPFFGPLKDRHDYFYNQGQNEFFRSRVQKYNSTVFRTNMPPGPFIASDPKVITVLDAISFPILFDTSKVEKKDIFDGTFMPSTNFTGGYRTLSYLDPSEPAHKLLKGFLFSLLTSLHSKFIPLFTKSLSQLFANLEDDMSKNGKSEFNTHSDNMSFEYVFQLFLRRSPSETALGNGGPAAVSKWLAVQLAPLVTLGLKYLPNFIEDFAIHTFPLPFFLVKSDYKKIYDVFYNSATSILDDAERAGIKRDEACHNLLFIVCFNTFGGLKTLFPSLFKWVGSAGEDLQRRLADEVRSVVKSEGGVNFSSLEKMTLLKSVVYEVLRIDPPVPFQYGKAKKDIVINSHDASFLIKKGEMIFGYQPFATKDAKIFENPEEFVGDRFVGDGEKLIKYVYWSNGRETDDPTVENKQCPGKNLIVLLSRVILVEFFLRYDSLTIESSPFLLGSSVTINSLTKAT